jgi:hypothetical protein
MASGKRPAMRRGNLESFVAYQKAQELFDLVVQDVERNQSNVNPNVAKVGGLQSQGVKGETVVGYLDPLTTQDLKSSGFPVG